MAVALVACGVVVDAVVALGAVGVVDVDVDVDVELEVDVDGAGVAAGAGAGAGALPDEPLDPPDPPCDPLEPPFDPPFWDPPKGSEYWSSPALWARADAGATSASATAQAAGSERYDSMPAR